MERGESDTENEYKRDDEKVAVICIHAAGAVARKHRLLSNRYLLCFALWGRARIRDCQHAVGEGGFDLLRLQEEWN